MTDQYPLVLTQKQRDALIHTTRLRTKLKMRLQDVEPGTQVFTFTRKELNELHDEVGQAAYYAVTPYKRPLLSVIKKTTDAFEGEMLDRFGIRERKQVSKGGVFQLKITLDGIEPEIWRRVQVKDCSLTKLHQVIQAVMGWADYHMYYFEIAGERYSDPQMIEDTDWKNAKKVRLSEVVKAGHWKLKYVYDMGDDWHHAITVEEALAPEPRAKYPRCIAGARACPPEDCGGIWGYEDFLEAIRDPKHEDHDEMLEWAGGEFDPEAFDLKAANKATKEAGR